jgi:poly-gamma-glutamate capsule biosynthesis protein CapA/YwtB (metallophosphatase superfamily)
MSYRLLCALLLSTIFFIQFINLGNELNYTISSISYGEIAPENTKHTVYLPFRNVVYNTVYSSAVKQEYESIVFVGDIMLARNVEAIMSRNGQDFPFAGLDLSQLAPNAAIVGNFESSMAIEHAQTPANNLKFSVNNNYLKTVNNAHFTHLSLANNHSFDFSESGYLNTIEQLSKYNIETFGHEYSVASQSISIVKTPHGAVALIGVNASDGRLDMAKLKLVIEESTRSSEMQIVFIHWGVEYDKTHHSSQKTLARAMVSMGVDLIVGHHPHVVQDIELIDDVPVFYSLGNYVFDQYFSNEVQQGLVLALDFINGGNVMLLPITSIGNLSQPRPMTTDGQARFLSDLAEKSDPRLQLNIKAGVIPLQRKVATSTKIAIMTR